MKNSLLLPIIFVFITHSFAQHISDFVSLPPLAKTSDFQIATEFNFQVILEEGDTLSDGTIARNNFDFTGYVPINSRSDSGYLSINHELVVQGGVDMMDIQLDIASQLWSISNSQKVDFTAVGGSARNCSGAVTPWNTIVTCEEYLSADLDSNGYDDFGWNIELDPVTKTIIDQPGGLVGGDKLWAMGKMKHENIVVHGNRRTSYYGADSNPGYVFKFVSTLSEKLHTGSLFVYKGSKNGVGQWIQLQNSTPAEQNSTLAQCDSINATNFSGVEDLEINPIDGSIHIAVKNENQIYRLVDPIALSGGSIPSVTTYVGNMNYQLTTNSGVHTATWGYGNDNLAFDDLGNLWVCQDGEEEYIWVVMNGHQQANPKVKIFGISPIGAEPTGMTFTPDFKYFFMSIQHPSATNNTSYQLDANCNAVDFSKDVALAIGRREYQGIQNYSQQSVYDSTSMSYQIINTYCNEPCINLLNLHNQVNNSGIYQAKKEIFSKGIIDSTTLYRAVDGILLEQDFEVKPGATFDAVIDSCKP